MSVVTRGHFITIRISPGGQACKGTGADMPLLCCLSGAANVWSYVQWANGYAVKQGNDVKCSILYVKQDTIDLYLACCGDSVESRIWLILRYVRCKVWHWIDTAALVDIFYLLTYWSAVLWVVGVMLVWKTICGVVSVVSSFSSLLSAFSPFPTVHCCYSSELLSACNFWNNLIVH